VFSLVADSPTDLYFFGGKRELAGYGNDIAITTDTKKLQTEAASI
jgi:hypothetical protein